MLLSSLLAGVALLLTAGAIRYVHRRRRMPLGSGTLALIGLCGVLGAWYTLNFGPWWFMERYLAPLLLLTIPFLASAFELSKPRPRALAVLAGVVLVANVPIFAVLAGGPSWPPPAWAARDTNLGTHTNLNYEDQYAWVRDHVRPGCVVGAFETGTLIYFRDHTVNLDGKVDHAALEARFAGRSPRVRRRPQGRRDDGHRERHRPRAARAPRRVEAGRGAVALPGVGAPKSRGRVPDRVGPTHDAHAKAR